MLKKKSKEKSKEKREHPGYSNTVSSFFLQITVKIERKIMYQTHWWQVINGCHPYTSTCLGIGLSTLISGGNELNMFSQNTVQHNKDKIIPYWCKVNRNDMNTDYCWRYNFISLEHIKTISYCGTFEWMVERFVMKRIHLVHNVNKHLIFPNFSFDKCAN